ncbi:MAG TPA: signal recognition particle receptor subunit alpha, partial [Spirochaetia bacterium]|nr:signal recognition particle receptor subunit alpha [Spirochaetia bacterium]
MALTGFGKRLRELFQSRHRDAAFFEDLEDALIEADIGVRFASETIQALREAARKDGIDSLDGLREALK